MKNLYAFILLTAAISGFSQSVNIVQPAPLCTPGTCVDLHADYTAVREATSYTVAPMQSVQTPYPYTGGTVIPAVNDDIFVDFQLPFTFCFYGQTYNTMLIGTNGVLSFNSGVDFGLTTGGYNCPWAFSSSIPNASFPIKNAIYGVYQDSDIRSTANDGPVTNPAVQNVNYYVGGQAPFRYLVVNFNELPSYQCGANGGLQTSQIILHETTNVIDIYVKKRSACISWNGGRGLIGIQNAAGTEAVVPPNRNTGTWTATNEAWCFSPNGVEVPMAFQWSVNAVPVSDAPTFLYCPQTDSTVSVSVTGVNTCNGANIAYSDQIELLISPPLPVQQPEDLYACETAGTATFNLSSVEPEVLDGLNPSDYSVSFYLTLMDAEEGNSNTVSMPFAFTGTDGQVIYVRVSDLQTISCAVILNFALHVSPSGWPQGESEQFFDAGDTLADLEVEGPDLEWYADAEGGEELPLSTPLVNGMTYYADTDEAQNCGGEDGRMSGSRFAVTVFDVAMGITTHDAATLQLAPNPVLDVLTIKSDAVIGTVSLFNLLGQQIVTVSAGSNEVGMDLSGLSAGTYLLKATTEKGILTAKVVRK